MPPRPSHPLASLSADELAYATSAFAAHVPTSQLTFYEVCLHEEFTSEQKAAILNSNDTVPNLRRARVVASDPQLKRVLEGHAPVSPAHADQRVLIRHLPETQPPVTADEYDLVERLVKEYEPFRVACRARGIDAADVRVDPWCVGWYGPEDDPDRRLAEPILYLQRGDSSVDSLYTQPLEGFTLRVDMWATPPRVISFDIDPDAPPPPMPTPLMRFPDPAGERARPPLPALRVSQPEGIGFELGSDGTLTWQRWAAVVSFTPREGAVLSALKYDGRPVAWRLSFSEMVVPYADPHPPHYRKSAFDAGEDGLGRNAHSLDPSRCDCAPGGDARFLDAALVTERGAAEVVRNAVCVHEEDGGLLWKHLDWRTGDATARRGRHLVIMFLCTVANYTYGFTYRLGIDGGIHIEATLTGILSIGILPRPPHAATDRENDDRPGNGERGAASRSESSPVPHRPWGQTLDPNGLYGPDHQHFFVARCDMAVDGLRNRVVEVEVEPAGTSTNDAEDKYALAHGRLNAFRRKATVLTSERCAAREADPRRARHWVVESTERVNSVGEPTAWRLEPGSGSGIAPACSAAAAHLERASFLLKNLWVSAYKPHERYPGGDYPNQRPPSRPDGLAEWTRRDAPLDGADLVLWHVFGVTHTVRTEDAPVMPCERVGFKLAPCGFLDVSPCVDVPCDAPACRRAGGGAPAAATPHSRL